MGQISCLILIATVLLFGMAFGMEEWKEKLLSGENHYRNIHGSPPLTYNPELEQRAQEWADNIATDMCTYAEHHAPQDSPGKWYNGEPLGENIKRGQTTKHENLEEEAVKRAATAADGFYAEEKGYPYGDYDPYVNKKKGHGHFTQMVWKDTRQVGYGLATCGGNLWFMVARYYPAGNVKSPDFNPHKDNVLPPQH